jgi:hypothetical protein
MSDSTCKSRAEVIGERVLDTARALGWADCGTDPLEFLLGVRAEEPEAATYSFHGFAKQESTMLPLRMGGVLSGARRFAKMPDEVRHQVERFADDPMRCMPSERERLREMGLVKDDLIKSRPPWIGKELAEEVFSAVTRAKWPDPTITYHEGGAITPPEPTVCPIGKREAEQREAAREAVITAAVAFVVALRTGANMPHALVRTVEDLLTLQRPSDDKL